jgi:hypothetical protein
VWILVCLCFWKFSLFICKKIFARSCLCNYFQLVTGWLVDLLTEHQKELISCCFTMIIWYNLWSDGFLKKVLFCICMWLENLNCCKAPTLIYVCFWLHFIYFYHHVGYLQKIYSASILQTYLQSLYWMSCEVTDGTGCCASSASSGCLELLFSLVGW